MVVGSRWRVKEGQRRMETVMQVAREVDKEMNVHQKKV